MHLKYEVNFSKHIKVIPSIASLHVEDFSLSSEFLNCLDGVICFVDKIEMLMELRAAIDIQRDYLCSKHLT